jgi:acyl-CoA thioester hydrolase
MRLHVPIGLRWSDLDAYGHVNNAAMLRLLEEARIQAFWADGAGRTVGRAAGATTAVLLGGPQADTLTFLARQEIEYLVALPYLRAPLDIQIWFDKLGGASLEVCYEVHAPIGTEPDVLYTRASTTTVLVDATTQRPRRINPVERVAWEPYVDEPIAFSRHR